MRCDSVEIPQAVRVKTFKVAQRPEGFIRLTVGLKVNAEALPPAVVQGILDKSISLTSPATTVALLKLNAVAGLKGTVETVNGADVLTRVGVTCAQCHSTVDDSFNPGIGKITSTSDGADLAYWNRYVGVTRMGGHGSFSEPRTGVNVTNGTDDLISAKLPALQA